MSWAAQYIGQEWVAGENDCWAFFRKIQERHFGRVLPVIDVDASNVMARTREFGSSEERKRWEVVFSPADGDGVLMARGRHPSHVGVWVGGAVLHCTQRSGVVYQKLAPLRLEGWTITFYRHV